MINLFCISLRFSWRLYISGPGRIRSITPIRLAGRRGSQRETLFSDTFLQPASAAASWCGDSSCGLRQGRQLQPSWRRQVSLWAPRPTPLLRTKYGGLCPGRGSVRNLQQSGGPRQSIPRLRRRGRFQFSDHRPMVQEEASFLWGGGVEFLENWSVLWSKLKMNKHEHTNICDLMQVLHSNMMEATSFMDVRIQCRDSDFNYSKFLFNIFSLCKENGRIYGLPQEEKSVHLKEA